MAVYVPINTINAVNTLYNNSQTITTVNCANIQWSRNSMTSTFSDCSNLVSVTGINNNVTNMDLTFNNCPRFTTTTIPNSIVSMRGTFMNCTSLTSSPNLPSTLTDLSQAYSGCVNLTNTPVIPNTVTNLSGTFINCKTLINRITLGNSITNMTNAFVDCNNLETIETIPNTVTDLSRTFYNCSKLYDVPYIPQSVTNITSCFHSCTNLPPNIYVQSSVVENADSCFANTSSTKNVYIPFFKGSTIEHSVTYNSFISAGYDTEGTTHGVHLKDINNTVISVTIEPVPINADVTFFRKHIFPNPLYAWTFRGTLAIQTIYTKTEDPAIGDYVYDAEGNILTGAEGNTVIEKGTSSVAPYLPTIGILYEHVAGLPVRALYERSTVNDIVYQWLEVPHVSTNCINLYDIPTTIKYTVSATGYNTYNSPEIEITESRVIRQELEPQLVTLTLTPNPIDCTVTLTCGSSIVSGTGTQAISVNAGSTITWRVEKEDYDTQTGTVPNITEDTPLAVALIQTPTIYTMTPISPADATVTLEANGYETVSGTGAQSITVEKGTAVTWTMSKNKYYTKTNTLIVSSTMSQTESLEPIPQLELIAEQSTAGSLTVTITTTDTYYVELVGAGGGGAWARGANRSGTIIYRRGAGGSGGYTAFTTTLTPGTYTATVGTGGAGATVQGGAITATAGTASSFQGHVANGGNGGYAYASANGTGITGGSGGSGETTNGNVGGTASSNTAACAGGASVYPVEGSIYGKGGSATAAIANNTGKDGYVRVYHYIIESD